MTPTVITCSIVALFIGVLLGMIVSGLCLVASERPSKHSLDHDFRMFMLRHGYGAAGPVAMNALRKAYFAGNQRGA